MLRNPLNDPEYMYNLVNLLRISIQYTDSKPFSIWKTYFKIKHRLISGFLNTIGIYIILIVGPCFIDLKIFTDLFSEKLNVHMERFIFITASIF